jgi:hypothetical protein
MAEAWDHFTEARDAETLASCFKVFEFLTKSKGFAKPDQPAFEQLLDGVDNHEKRQRVAQIIKALCLFFHLGRHEEGKQNPPVNRRDAEYALILTQATLRLLASTIAKPPEAVAKKRSHKSSGVTT